MKNEGPDRQKQLEILDNSCLPYQTKNGLHDAIYQVQFRHFPPCTIKNVQVLAIFFGKFKY